MQIDYIPLDKWLIWNINIYSCSYSNNIPVVVDVELEAVVTVVILVVVDVELEVVVVDVDIVIVLVRLNKVMSTIAEIAAKRRRAPSDIQHK